MKHALIRLLFYINEHSSFTLMGGGPSKHCRVISDSSKCLCEPFQPSFMSVGLSLVLFCFVLPKNTALFVHFKW